MQVCLFDIDGTLLNSGGAGKAAIEAALVEEFGVTLGKQVTFSGRTDRAIVRDLLRGHSLEATHDNVHRLVQGYLQRLPAALAKHQGTILPGIESLLETLADQGVALGLLTGNIRQGAQVKLGHFDLWRPFAFGGFGDHHLDRDDVARDALAAAHKHFDTTVEPDQVWVIGDTPLDVRCARAIGVRVLAVATGWHTVEQLNETKPDLLLKDLSDPAAFFELL